MSQHELTRSLEKAPLLGPTLGGSVRRWKLVSRKVAGSFGQSIGRLIGSVIGRSVSWQGRQSQLVV